MRYIKEKQNNHMKAIKQSKYNFKLSTHQRHTRNQHDQMHENDGTINTIKMEGQG